MFLDFPFFSLSLVSRFPDLGVLLYFFLRKCCYDTIVLAIVQKFLYDSVCSWMDRCWGRVRSDVATDMD